MLRLPNINVQPLTFAQLDGSDDSFNISLLCQPWEEHNGFVHNQLFSLINLLCIFLITLYIIFVNIPKLPSSDNFLNLLANYCSFIWNLNNLAKQS